jgi:hypothetical protein
MCDVSPFAGVICVEKMELQVATVMIAVEQQHLVQLANFLALAGKPFAVASVPGDAFQAHEPDLEMLTGGASQRHVAEQKVYIEHLWLPRIAATVSFLPTPWDPSSSAGAAPETAIRLRFECWFS